MKEPISKKQLREFGLLIGLGFPLLLGWLFPAIAGHDFRAWTLYVGIPGLILGLASPGLLLYPYKGWMALGHALGWVNSHLVLGLVFVVVVQPIALVMKLSGYDPLRMRRRVAAASYRENRQQRRSDLNRIF